MNLSEMIVSLQSNVTPFTVTLFVLLVLSEVLGSVQSIKTSSLYNLFRSILMTIKDEALPKKTVVVEPTVVSANTSVPQ